MGFDPDVDRVSLLLVVARQNSVLRHLDGVTNPLRTFDAQMAMWCVLMLSRRCPRPSRKKCRWPSQRSATLAM